MKKSLLAVIALLIGTVGVYAYLSISGGQHPAPAPAPEDAKKGTWAIIDETKPGDAATADVNADAPAGALIENANEPAAETTNVPDTESHVTTMIAPQYWPEASVNLSGGKLGTQRVPFTEDIGDVNQVVFDLPSYTLFMSVTEPDGLRSVWQMKENRKPERVFAGTAVQGDLVLFRTSDGVIYVQQDNPCSLYRSGDGLKSWHLVSKDACMFWSMADDGKGNVYGTLHNWNEAVLYHSPDNGFSWEPWVDFQKVLAVEAKTYAEGDDRFRLRHLHDVIYDPTSDKLFVGTGDIARFALMSADDGKTWQKVWNEGFTAHVRMGGGDRYLLGPDQLHNHGIALMDVAAGTVKEVWNPRPYGYAGYVYSMTDVDGIYYAATHTETNEVESVVPKFGIIVSPNGTDWYKFLEWGPLTNHARTNVWMTSAPGIVYASVNGALYAFRPLDKDWFADKTPFGK